MAKKKLGGFNLKQVVLQKGERYGFYLAGGLLLLFIFLGGYKAASSASTGTIVSKFDQGVKQIDQKIAQKPGEQPKELDKVIYDDPTVARIPFTSFAVKNDLWDTTRNDQTRRLNPRLLSPTAAQVDFVRGSIETYDIIEENGMRLIAVLKERQKAANDQSRIPERIRKGKRVPPPPVLPPGVIPPPPIPPAGGGDGRGGGGGGPTRGGGGRMGGLVGPGSGGFTPPTNIRSTETVVEYKPLADKDIDSASLAKTIWPQRMVVVTASVPYRQQVEEYRRALRAQNKDSLSEFPEYRGFVVERRVYSLDGKTLESDWSPLDIQATLRDLFARTVDFEPENPPASMPADLKALYPRVLPPEEFELLVPRPMIYRRDPNSDAYPPVRLPTVFDALKSLVEKGEKVAEVRTTTQLTIDETNIFKRGTGNVGGQNGPGGAAVPPPGRGGSDSRPGFRLPGMPPPAGSGNQPTRAEDEDAWILRFIDVTVEAGHLYQYRVAIKALNPNYQKSPKDLAVPALALKEFLQSEFFEVQETAVVPPDEHLYAATKDERKNHVTDKRPLAGLWDETWVQMQRWYAFIRPEGLPRQEPFGEWLVSDLKVRRGEYIGQKESVLLPLWSMENGMFLFREPPRSRPAPSVVVGTVRRPLPTWTLDLMPTPPVLLVDFEGGSGDYFGPKNKQVNDAPGVEMLLLNADGSLRVERSGPDLSDADRSKRETTWLQWLEKVSQDSIAAKTRAPSDGSGGERGGNPRGP
jgi:hypothetical protein